MCGWLRWSESEWSHYASMGGQKTCRGRYEGMTFQRGPGATRTRDLLLRRGVLPLSTAQR